MTWIVSGLATAILASIGTSGVMATPYVRALTAAYDQNTGFNVQDTGQIAGPLGFAESGPFADPFVPIGNTFHAKAYALFTPSGPELGAYSTVDNNVPLFQAETPAEAWWSATLTVTGTPGTQVTFNLGIHLADALSGIVYPGFPSNLGVEAVADLIGTGAYAGLSIHDSLVSPAASKTVWKLMTFNVGDVVTLGGDLTTNASAQGGTATADAFSTGLFALQILTPGGGYTTENDMVFATSFDVFAAVPEPETYLMVLTGLGLLGFVARRRRQTPRNPA
jgi:hypothetical protein